VKRGGAVYIISNKVHSSLYIGVTSDLKKRVYEHKNNAFPGSFTAKYKLHKLVYFEGFHRIEEAIAREKLLKGGSRNTKNELINSMNPKWSDLFDDLLL
jgi:putative endonuclease